MRKEPLRCKSNPASTTRFDNLQLVYEMFRSIKFHQHTLEIRIKHNDYKTVATVPDALENKLDGISSRFKQIVSKLLFSSEIILKYTCSEGCSILSKKLHTSYTEENGKYLCE